LTQSNTKQSAKQKISNIDIKQQHQQNDLTKIRENNLIYDRHGIINLNILYRINSKIFLFGIMFYTQIVLYLLWALKYNIIVTDVNIYIQLMKQYLYSCYYQINNFNFNSEFILIHSITILLTILSIIIFDIYIYKKAKIQKRLASVGLSNYYLKSKNKNEYTFKLRLGEVMEYDKFLKSFENIKQTFSKNNVKFQRYNEIEIKVIFIDNFPEIEDLKGLSPKDYLKKDKIFLGFGINTKNSKDKFEAKYLNMDDLPVGVANLGSAGGGKSNTMNQWLYSIFHNFNRIEKFYFIDFKGGIEAEPINDLEKKFNTNKIEVLDDNRLRLFEILKQLNIINKARMLYLKTNKLKKFTDNYIYVIFDELAEILDYEPKEKQEREIQNDISSILESLLRTGRSQGIKIFYSTQSFLSTSSGLTSGMKNNTKLRVLHQTKNKMAIGSVIPMEELEEQAYDPYNYNMGRNLVISDETIEEVRSLYIPDNFLDEIIINKEFNSKLANDMKKFYKLKMIEMIKDRDKLSNENNKDEIYTLENIAKDLDVELDTQKMNTIPTKSNLKQVKKESVSISLNKSKQQYTPNDDIKSFFTKMNLSKKKLSKISDTKLKNIDVNIDIGNETNKLKKLVKTHNSNIDIEKELAFLEEN